MAITFACASCETPLKVADSLAGKSVRCPRCGAVSAVPEEDTPPVEAVVPERAKKRRPRDDEEEDDFEDHPVRRRKSDRPQRRSGNNGISKGLIIALAAGGGTLLLLISGGVVWWFLMPELNPNVTEENIKKIKPGMTLDEVEQILGKGKKATEGDLNAVNRMMQGAGSSAQFRRGTTTYRWRNRNTWLFIDVDNNTNKIVGVHSWSHS